MAATTGGWLVTDGPLGTRDVVAPGGAPAIGGPFTLTDHRGTPVTERDFRGKPVAIFFGFTFCPDICPTTLNEMSGWIAQLGSAAERLHWLFVSVDSERDTPAQMAEYVGLFDKHIVGLSGTPSEIAEVTSGFRVYYRRIVSGDTVTFDHAASVFLLNADGTFAGTIDYKESPAVALQKLRTLLARAG